MKKVRKTRFEIFIVTMLGILNTLRHGIVQRIIDESNVLNDE